MERDKCTASALEKLLSEMQKTNIYYILKIGVIVFFFKLLMKTSIESNISILSTMWLRVIVLFSDFTFFKSQGEMLVIDWDSEQKYYMLIYSLEISSDLMI